MKTRELGRSGLRVPALGLGCMGFSHAYGPATEKEKAIRLIRHAFDLGYTFFDTAEVYGTQDDPHANESLVGEALEEVRDRVVIATKFGIHFDRESGKIPSPLIADSRPEVIVRSVEDSLRRLRTKTIDLYFQHRIDPRVEPETVASVMKDLIRQGKIRSWGVSEANEQYIRRAHAVCPIATVQNRYSIMARQHEALFDTLQELGIGLVAFSPLANGFLSGQYDQSSQFDQKTDYHSAMPQFTVKALRQNQQMLELLNELARRKQATPAQISLAWMLAKKPWIVPIPGTRSAARMAENAAAAAIQLSEAEMTELENQLRTMPMSEVYGGTRLKG